MRHIFVLLFSFISFIFCNAQEVQWASSVTDYSSQLSENAFSAKQVLGVPNAMSGAKVEHMAWAAKKENSYLGEHLEVEFAKPVRIAQVIVAESKNPGAISRIVLFDVRGKRKLVYDNSFPEPTSESQRLFRHTFPMTDFEIRKVLVEIKTSAVPGSNQIDAIGISNGKQEIALKVETLNYSEPLPSAEKLNAQINSPFAERLPLISPDGKTLYFARKYHPQNFGEDNQDDIWVANLQADGSWSRAINIGAPLNDEQHNFVVAVSPSGDILYLANDYRFNKKDGVSISKKAGRTWSRPEPLDIEDHYNLSVFVGYHFNVNGDILLMSVERRDGFGDRDLYVSFKQNRNKWSKPMNLGEQINTVGLESSIFLAADGKTIYFASNGHSGYGGLDMFMSRRLDDSWTNWSKPINLGQKINTSGNDYNYSIPASGDYAYFSVDDAKGMSDLYRIPLPKEVQPEPVLLVTGQIVDAETKKSLNAELTVQELKSQINQKPINAKEGGQFKMVIPYGENMEIFAEKEGYFAVSENLELANENLEELDYDIKSSGKIDESENSPVATKEIESIQLRLNKLGKEVETLEASRKETTQKPRQIVTSKASYNDPELEALRQKFETFVLKNKSVEKTPEPSPQIPEAKKDLTTKGGDKDLEKMMAAYRKAHGIKGENEIDSRAILNKKTSTEENNIEELKKEYHKKNNPKAPSPFEKPSVKEVTKQSEFDALEKEVRMELEKELIVDIKLDLQKKLLEDVKNEVAAELDEQEQEQLKEPGFDRQIKDECAESVKEELRFQYLEEIKTELKEEWQAQIKEELREAMIDEVRTELRRALREEVKEELRREMKYQIKKEVEAELRQELSEKLQQEIETEQQRSAAQADLQNQDIDKPEPSYQEIEKEIVLIPIKVGQVIPMNNIFFDSNEASLKSESFPELERVLDFLKTNAELIVEVGGHTNGWCSHVFASELSDGRAKRVAEFFKENGIPSHRIQHKGYGKTKPVASNDTVSGRKQNQRVELTILEVK